MDPEQEESYSTLFSRALWGLIEKLDSSLSLKRLCIFSGVEENGKWAGAGNLTAEHRGMLVV